LREAEFHIELRRSTVEVRRNHGSPGLESSEAQPPTQPGIQYIYFCDRHTHFLLFKLHLQAPQKQSVTMSTSESFQPMQTSSPTSLTSSRRTSGAKTPLSLDLSDLPPLITPSPPSNTLLITVRTLRTHRKTTRANLRPQNLDDIAIFEAQNLKTIRDLINQHATIHTWSPLKSFRRIIAVFNDVESAKLIKQTLDGETVFDCRVRVYFGAPTDISDKDRHLEAPKSDKLFFISPPPSPPHGWEMRNEGPPNKEVHAEDLAQALARLHARKPSFDIEMELDYSPVDGAGGRNRSGSVLVYHPDQHGDSPNLPAISVEDLTHSPPPTSPLEDSFSNRRIAHTVRPPVELMEH
jgi:Calcipressin